MLTSLTSSFSRLLPLDEQVKANTLEVVEKVRLHLPGVVPCAALILPPPPPLPRLRADTSAPGRSIGNEQMYEQSIFEFNQRNTPAPLKQQVDIRSVIPPLDAGLARRGFRCTHN